MSAYNKMRGSPQGRQARSGGETDTEDEEMFVLAPEMVTRSKNSGSYERVRYPANRNFVEATGPTEDINSVHRPDSKSLAVGIKNFSNSKLKTRGPVGYFYRDAFGMEHPLPPGYYKRLPAAIKGQNRTAGKAGHDVLSEGRKRLPSGPPGQVGVRGHRSEARRQPVNSNTGPRQIYIQEPKCKFLRTKSVKNKFSKARCSTTMFQNHGGREDKGAQTGNEHRSRRERVCFRCKQATHVVRNCPFPRRNRKRNYRRKPKISTETDTSPPVQVDFSRDQSSNTTGVKTLEAMPALGLISSIKVKDQPLNKAKILESQQTISSQRQGPLMTKNGENYARGGGVINNNRLGSTDTILHVPFVCGFTRNVFVWTDVEGTINNEVYYQYHAGKEINSKNINLFLADHPELPLTTYNFCFDELTIYKPPLEKITHEGDITTDESEEFSNQFPVKNSIVDSHITNGVEDVFQSQIPAVDIAVEQESEIESNQSLRNESDIQDSTTQSSIDNSQSISSSISVPLVTSRGESSSSNIPSVITRPKSVTPKRDEPLHKPFACGWTRSVVIWRHYTGPRVFGVYYRYKEGEEIYSWDEMSLFLAVHTEIKLGTDNFCFNQVTIYKPPFETIIYL